MTTSSSGQVAAARETARRPDGEFGPQPRAEVEVGDLVAAVEEEPADPYAGWLAVSDADRKEVEKISTLLGANPGEESERTWDATDAETLLTYAPDLARMLGRVSRSRTGRSIAEKQRIARNHEIARQRLDRFARELVGWIWEERRLRVDEGPIRSDKYTDGAAWSPAALRVILTPDGDPIEGTPWKNALTLEHVVPAATVARLLARMHAEGKTSSEVAEALRGTVHQVVVKKGRTESDRRDEPAATGMHPDMEKKLIRHVLGEKEHRLDAEELFRVTWSRYLDPKMRGTDGREMDWHLGQLRTVTKTLGVHERDR